MSSSAVVAPSRVAPSRARLTLLRVAGLAYAVLTAVVSFGLPSLLTSWFTAGDELPLRTAYVVWGVLAGLLIPGLALSLWRPSVAVWRALAALVLGTLGALALAFEPENLAYAAVIVGPALVLLALHPGARDAMRPAPMDRATAVIAAVAAIPAVWWGVDLAARSRATSNVDTMHGQYAQGAVLAFTLALIALVGALRQAGRRVVVLLASVSVGLLGLAGIWFPDDLMSLGTTGGLVSLVAAVVYAFVALRDDERHRG